MSSKSQQPDRQENHIVIWSKVVDTQMHFNEMSAKSRQLGLTFTVAVLGVAVVLISRGNDFSFVLPVFGCNIQLHVSVLLFIVAWLALETVKILDLHVYHRMLRGAVAFGEDFEEKYMKQIFDLPKGMTQAISHFSRYEDAERKIGDDGSATYEGTTHLTAEKKIKAFYGAARKYIIIGAALLFIGTNLAESSLIVQDGAATSQSTISKALETQPDHE
jgi:hypothetical protein